MMTAPEKHMYENRVLLWENVKEDYHTSQHSFNLDLFCKNILNTELWKQKSLEVKPNL